MYRVINKNQPKLPKPSLRNGIDARLQRDSDQVPNVSLILIESNSLLRDGLTKLLGLTHFHIVASCSSFEEIPPSLECSPNLILIGGNRTAFILAALKNCSNRFPAARRVVLDDFHEEHVMMMIDAGAHACLGIDITTKVLLISLDLVMNGNSIVCQPDFLLGKHLERNRQNGHAAEITMSGRCDLNEVSHRLSTREIGVLERLMHGDSNKLIARRLQIAETTVKVHIKTILRKIRAANRTQAAIWAMRHLSSNPAQEIRKDY
jgi:two-component system, NarL family, nitrate/nitrite response regulator NarL